MTQQVQRHTMFLDWKNQYCENDYTTQSYLQIQCNPYQITNGSLHRTGTKTFTICMVTQKTLNSQSKLEKEKSTGGMRFPDFRLNYKATVIKTVWFWHKSRNIDERNWIQIPDINPHVYGHLICDKGGKNI